MEKKNQLISQPNKTNKFLYNLKQFSQLLVDNLKHIGDRDYKPHVEPEFEVLARGLDKTQAAIVTMLIQAIIGRNLLGGKLSDVRVAGEVAISGRILMGINRGSYIGSIYMIGKLGKDALLLVQEAYRELSMSPLYEGLNSSQLYQLTTALFLYALSWVITIFQTTNDWTHLYKKYRYKVFKKHEESQDA